MATIAVSGACSRAGKTALAVTVLRSLGEGVASALKFTTTDDVFERCPRGTPCVVCDIDVPFRVIEDPRVLRESGTDTDRLAAAGARRVLWCIARLGAAERAWRHVRERLASTEGPVVIEGSTIVDIARPDVNLFVVHPFLSPERWKPTSGPLIAAADAVVVNRPANEPREPATAVLAAIRAFRPRRDPIVADVTQPLASWGGDLRERMDTLVRSEPRPTPAA